MLLIGMSTDLTACQVYSNMCVRGSSHLCGNITGHWLCFPKPCLFLGGKVSSLTWCLPLSSAGRQQSSHDLPAFVGIPGL